MPVIFSDNSVNKLIRCVFLIVSGKFKNNISGYYFFPVIKIIIGNFFNFSKNHIKSLGYRCYKIANFSVINYTSPVIELFLYPVKEFSRRQLREIKEIQ